MFEVKAELRREEFEAVERLIFEADGMEHWNLYENFDDKGYWVQGVFETRQAAESGKVAFIRQMPIQNELIVRELEDRDWKESYKDHFKPWAIDNLHWAPLWLKDEYELPEGHKAVWLDPGMAFGTGNHATTRLCVEQLIAFKASGSGDRRSARLVDAGCGSGILAISAAKLGFSNIEAFDIDPDAVRIAKENAEINQEPTIQFRVASLDTGLSINGPSECILANILANALVANARELTESVVSGGWLVLSGILGTEMDEVAARFRVFECWSQESVDYLDEWASLTLVKK